MNKPKQIYTLDEIKQIASSVFSQYPTIQSAYLFGSYARGEATENSDLDFMIVLSRPVGLEFFGLYDLLQDKFGKLVDVISEKEAYKIMPKSIERDKVLIYERKNESNV